VTVRITLVVLGLSGLVLGALALTRGGSPTVVGDAVHGRVLFRGYCSGCHTLKAAGSHGRFGPNIDNMAPTYAQVVQQIVTGGTQGAGLPPTARLTFGRGIHEFTKSDIHDIAAFVFSSTHA